MSRPTTQGILEKDEFEILYAALKADRPMTQRDMSLASGFSLGKVNTLSHILKEKDYITEDLKITKQGEAALAPYKVKNAVIMAAGMSSRFAPLSYEKPKGLLNVKGEVLIEREIRQLHEAGIKDITIVVGYKKEKMFYLAEKYDADIIVNENYSKYNNTSTLMLVPDRLNNTYICSSDNYFTENPFESYVYRAYYAAVYAEGKTDEYCMYTDNKGRIKKVVIGGENAWYMLGHVYFDRTFSRKFSEILKREYDNQATKEQLWEQVYMRHIKELDMYIKKYDEAVIKEFDSLEELRQFDSKYLKNTHSEIFTNICEILGCKEEDIQNIAPVNKRLTNLSFVFSVKGGKQYLYRHPGPGTGKIINRQAEAEASEIAKRLGLDETFVYLDSKKGWMISKYVDRKQMDYHDEKQVKQALKLLNKLHKSNEKINNDCSIGKGINRLERLIHSAGVDDFEEMDILKADMKKLCRLTENDGYKPCLCHCDSYDRCFQVDGKNKMYLENWEYSGMSDPGFDVGTFIVCSDYRIKEAEKVIEIYLGHKPDEKELAHFIAYAALAAFFWFLWSLYEDSVGKDAGQFMVLWYRYCKQYGKYAFELYDKIR